MSLRPLRGRREKKDQACLWVFYFSFNYSHSICMLGFFVKFYFKKMLKPSDHILLPLTSSCLMPFITPPVWTLAGLLRKEPWTHWLSSEVPFIWASGLWDHHRPSTFTDVCLSQKTAQLFTIPEAFSLVSQFTETPPEREVISFPNIWWQFSIVNWISWENCTKKDKNEVLLLICISTHRISYMNLDFN